MASVESGGRAKNLIGGREFERSNKRKRLGGVESDGEKKGFSWVVFVVAGEEINRRR